MSAAEPTTGQAAICMALRMREQVTHPPMFHTVQADTPRPVVDTRHQ